MREIRIPRMALSRLSYLKFPNFHARNKLGTVWQNHRRILLNPWLIPNPSSTTDIKNLNTFYMNAKTFKDDSIGLIPSLLKSINTPTLDGRTTMVANDATLNLHKKRNEKKKNIALEKENETQRKGVWKVMHISWRRERAFPRGE